MSGESKFAKLRLPVSKRSVKKSSSTSSQISAFFAQTAPTTSVNFEENLTNSELEEQTSINFKDEHDVKLPSSLPERILPESSSSTERKPLFASFESIKPSKLPRVDTDKSTNRSTIKEFFTANVNENDFESPPAKVAKKATTFKKKQKATAVKRQPKIKNAFLRREEIIGNYIAEQSIADDVDPNEMQMALALSKSEIETFRIEGDPEASNGSTNSMEAICDKLEEFGYRVGRNKINHPFYGASTKVKAKWANKFTSLTLRNADRQQEKVNKKVEEFLNSQYNRTKSLDSGSLKPLEVASSFLSHMKAENYIHQRHKTYEFNGINEFYVTDIIKPTSNKVGSLLRDFHAIPGRDISPPRVQSNNEKNLKQNTERVELAYEKSEENDKISVCTSSSDMILADKGEEYKICREPSPDLFMEEEESITEIIGSEAKSAEETTASKAINQKLSMDIVTLSSESNSNGILTCEKFSSDEVKTADGTGIWNQDLSYTLKNLTGGKNEDEELEKLIDLTQEELVDLTQKETDIDSLNLDDFLQGSIRSRKSNGTDLNSSQETLSSIIVLSDDEVNYSIKVAHGLDINENSANKSELDSLNLSQNTGARTSVGSINADVFANKSTQHQTSTTNFDLDSCDNDEDDVLECNNLTGSSNKSFEDKLNYSLAHEIMSRSFEEFEQIGNKSPHSKKTIQEDDIPFLDLTLSKSPSGDPGNEACCSKTLSQNIYSEIIDKRCDKTDESLSDKIGWRESDDEDFLFQDYNICNYPKYTEFIEEAKEDHRVTTVVASNSSELKETHEENELQINIPCLDLTQTPPSSFEKICYPSTSKHSNSYSLDTSTKLRKTHSDSFLIPKTKTPNSLKRHSSSNKFEEFLKVDDDDDDLDEFDRMVYTNKQTLNFKTLEIVNKPFTNKVDSNNDSNEEIVYDNKTYLVRTKNVNSKPDYHRMDSPTRLKELYKYGLKPLKKKQAIIMLEYIYNQTHPCIVDNDSDTNEDNRNSNYSEKVHVNESEEAIAHENKIEEEILETGNVSKKPNKYNFKDCDGFLLIIEDGLSFETEHEEYIFQTNIRTKISTVLLPLHLAWFNLVRSNEKLRESILYYEPIDLQEIFIFFKSIGYRYDPKDLKRFFDSRSIIFQYDLSKDGSNRHIRKSQKQKVKKK